MSARLRQMLASLQGGGGQEQPAVDQPLPDTSEKIQISSLSLLKMLKHGKYLIIIYLSTCNSYIHIFMYLFRPRWSSYGSYGTYVGSICR